jgi:multicomponent Na+:H+ antiporter subunit D
MLTGVLLHRFGTVDEFDLHGAGRVLPQVGVLFAAGGLLLAAVPLSTAFFGKSLLDAAAIDGGYPWLPAVFVISSICTGGAVLRIAGRVFMGWGTAEPRGGDRQPAPEPAQDEETVARDRTPPLMVIVPAVLLAGAIVVGLIPGLVPDIERAAAHFHDHVAYIGWVLRGGQAHFPPASTSHVQAYDFLYGAAATLGALGLAGLGLFGGPARERLPQALLGPLLAAVNRLRALHSGHIGDYIAWWTAGAALLGGASLVLLT